MRSRQEGHVCELRTPPKYRSVQGFIAVQSTPERLFFQESLSGIAKREAGNIRMHTIVQFSVDKNENGFFAKDLFIKLPEIKQAQCRCGWEHLVGKGIQEGFIGVLQKARYGFITKDFPRERNPTGIYFSNSNLRGYSFEQLRIGDRVHFVVGQNDKGCVAEQIDVQGKTQFPVSQGNYPTSLHDPRLFSGNPLEMFLPGQRNLGQFSALPHAHVSPNAMPGRPFQDPDEGWQDVTRRKR